MTDPTPPFVPDADATGSTILNVPRLPGTGPHDGERPRWWLFENDFVKSLTAPGVRGLPSQPPLSDSDIKTLSDALSAIRGARTMMKSTQAVDVKEGAFSLVRTTGYLAGFLGAKGFAPFSSTLASLAKTSSDPSERDGLLDAIEQGLMALINPTRSLAAAGAVAGIVLPWAGAFLVVGVGLKLYASTLPDEVGG